MQGGDQLATRQKDGWVQIPPFMVTEEMAEQIENVRFEERYQNRTEALRAIIQAGIRSIQEKRTAPGK